MAEGESVWSARLEGRTAAAGSERREGMPAAIPLDLHSSVADLYRGRIDGVFNESHAGIPMLKFPEDLRTYEHLIWQARVEAVVELGTFLGGSALWFRDRMRTLQTYGLIGTPRVITIDLETDRARERLTGADPSWEDEIQLVAGDVTDPDLAEEVRARIPAGASCLVVDDSGHTPETTLGALRGYAGLVQPGGFLVLEDTVGDIDEMRASADWPQGVLPALEEWLATPEGQGFTIRRDLELYGLTCHPFGFLQRCA